MRIAIIGFGGVGKALIKLIDEKKEILLNSNLDLSVNYILNSSGGVYDKEGVDCGKVALHVEKGNRLSDYPKGGSTALNFNEIISKKDIDILIEMTPTNKETGEPGLTYIKEALLNGINVITANKGPIMLAYKQLKDIAIQENVQLAVGCTAGGALPTVNAGLIDMAGSEIKSIEGIFNGTSNYVLGEMEKRNISYKQAIEEAQSIGIAETDPSLDVEGWDTAIKLLILTNILMNESKTLDDIHVQGITQLSLDEINHAKAEGERYKLIGKAEKNNEGVKLLVELVKIDSDDIFYNANEKNKIVRYVSDTLGELVLYGGASGVKPAAASVLRDLINLSKGYKFN